jgi:hypothetical protein
MGISVIRHLAMKHGPKLFGAAAILPLLFGCSLFSIESAIEEEYLITPATDADSVLLFHKPLTWANGQDETATRAVFLPEGEYTYEGENDDFRYFRAPTLVTMGMFYRGRRTGGFDFDGGVAVAISRFAQIPAEVYISRSNDEKIHVMRMGYDFFLLRDETWTLKDAAH